MPHGGIVVTKHKVKNRNLVCNPNRIFSTGIGMSVGHVLYLAVQEQLWRPQGKAMPLAGKLVKIVPIAININDVIELHVMKTESSYLLPDTSNMARIRTHYAWCSNCTSELFWPFSMLQCFAILCMCRRSRFLKSQLGSPFQVL